MQCRPYIQASFTVLPGFTLHDSCLFMRSSSLSTSVSWRNKGNDQPRVNSYHPSPLPHPPQCEKQISKLQVVTINTTRLSFKTALRREPVAVDSNIQWTDQLIRHMYQYEPSRDLTIKVYNVHVEVLSNIQTNSYVTCINMNLHGT